ncbi:hypothetical protein SAMN03159495_0215 [Pseudomonas sp. NFR16]|nr:hypothetical protein SAMN03159495_0215 [Pseudomonas sp. NFR16]
MKCYLCGLDAQQDMSPMGKLVTCRDCGTYKISEIVLRELGSRKLNFSKMRDDLHRQRQYNATSVAEINSETAIWG